MSDESNALRVAADRVLTMAASEDEYGIVLPTYKEAARLMRQAAAQIESLTRDLYLARGGIDLEKQRVQHLNETCERREQTIGLLRAELDAAKVPDGWKILPLGTSWDMRNECRELLIDYGVKHNRLDALAVAIWQTMCDAAPSVETARTQPATAGEETR